MSRIGPEKRKAICCFRRGPSARCAAATLALVAILAPCALAQRTRLKPGWNLFTPQQDVEIGREVEKQAETQLLMLKDKRVDDYLERLGRNLATKAPGEKYPYQFKAVNDPGINAFALPGGFLFVNRGTIEAADNEAQLAGVIGHEIGHAALRHGTNQMSKANVTQLLLGGVAGLTGSNSVAGLLTQLGVSFGANSLLLKYSRDAERQADIVGTQILYDNGYDPRAMAQFFEKLEKESKSRPIQFFSSHPNPENRVTAVNAEINKMGGQQANYRNDSAEFRAIQKYVRSLPPPPKTPPQPADAAAKETGPARPTPPGGKYLSYENAGVSIQYPEGWRTYGSDTSFALAPEGGLKEDGKGNTSLSYGTMMAVFTPRGDAGQPATLQSATEELLAHLRTTSPNLRVRGNRSATRVAGQSALSLMLNNTSPLGGNEIDWLVTVLRPNGLTYFVFVAPESEFRGFQQAFENMLASVRFTRN